MKEKTSALLKRAASTAMIAAILAAALALIVPVSTTKAAASVPAISNPILIASNGPAVTTSESASNGCLMTAFGCAGFTQFVRFDSQTNTWYVMYPTTNSGAGGTMTFEYVYSTDGVNWAAPVAAATTANSVYAGTVEQDWGFDVYGNSMTIGYTYYGGSTTTVGVQYITINIANPASPSISQADTFVTVGTVGANARPASVDVKYATGGSVYFAFNLNAGVAAGNTFYQLSTTAVLNSKQTSGSCLNGNSEAYLSPSGSPTMVLEGTGSSSASTNCGNLYNGNAFFSPGATAEGFGRGTAFQNPNSFIGYVAAVPISGSSLTCGVYVWNSVANSWTLTNPTGAGTCGTWALQSWVGSDGGLNVWALWSVTSTFSYSSDSGNTWSGAISVPNSILGKTVSTLSMSDIYTVGGVQMALLVSATCTASSCVQGGYTTTGNIYVQTISLGSTVSTKQTQTLGSCPSTKATAFFPFVNNTMYLYYGNALGSTVVTQIQVAGITYVPGAAGTVTPQHLKLELYASVSATVSSTAPLTKLAEQDYVITSGTVNNTITLNVNSQITGSFIGTGVTFGVGVIGTSHLKMWNSTVTGLFLQSTSTPSSSSQPATFTGQGTANKGTKGLQLCASASYQTSITSTTTVTQAASTTTTITVTSTVTTIGASLFSTASNWPVIFFILLLPAGLLLGATKTLTGALLGLVVGAVIGALMGIFPSWAFLGLVISLVAVAFLARNRE